MKIFIAGGGKVGVTLARQLAAEGHDLTLIDENRAVLSALAEQLDIMTAEGNCAAMDTLVSAGIRDAELLIAVTNLDEVNLLCCMTAHNLNPKLHTIARIRNPEYTDQIFKLRDAFGISLTVNPERQAAIEIERLLKFPGFLRRDTFAKGRAEIVELRIKEDSPLCNAALLDMYKLLKTRVLVCAVLRDGTAHAPKGDFVLKAGDRIFVTAPTHNLTVLLKNLGIITRRTRRVMLCGGDRIAYYLTELLLKDGIAVHIIDQRPERCRDLAEQFAEATVVCGDCCDRELLESEQLASCDAVVTLTGLDEMNMVVSLYAASREVGQVITKLSRQENIQLAGDLNTGSIICARELCSNTIVRYVRAMQNQSGAAVSVHTIADGQVEAVEFLLDETAENCGKPLKELKLKKDMLIASITHGSGAIVPGGDSVFYPGDTVVAVTSSRGSLRQFNDIFA